MLLNYLVFVRSGDVNGVLIVFLKADYRIKDSDKLNEKKILDTFRYDYEAHFVGKNVPKDTDSKDPSVVEFYYTATMEKQALYKKLPVSVGDSYDIIDAFVCLGSRFGLEPLQVFVEVCRSKLGNRQYWANIYYITNSQIPACIIRVEEYGGHVDDQVIKEQLALDAKELVGLQKAIKV